jgi:mono/diheme cytochrome c family protein
MGLGAVTLTIAVLAVLAWLAYLVNAGRARTRRREEAAHNQSFFMEDAELETGRLNGVLVSALVASAVLAIVIPVYFLDESSRQVEAAERFDEIAVERGHEWYLEFQCGDCHGPDGGGGGAAYVEARSGLSTTWAAPALNDVLYRYSEEEVRYWLVYGRQGSPMPAWGAAGGGPLNSQQIDELIAYLDSIQLPQSEVLAQTDGRVGREVSRLAAADDSLRQAISRQLADISALQAAPDQYEAISGLPARLAALLSQPGTCTRESAALVGLPCDDEGRDADRDGLSDEAESAINDLIAEMLAAAPASDATQVLEGITFDPASRYSTTQGTREIDDFVHAEAVVAEFDAIERDLRLTVGNLDRLVETAEAGRVFLEEALGAERYSIDFDRIAAEAFDGKVADAQRAAALYNAYCARCHTAGYSAGLPYTQEVGSGALGPSLRDGRSVVQFPDDADHLDFIVNGSVNGVGYGVNGIGRGWMPGFGAVLTQEDLMLIVEFERAL